MLPPHMFSHTVFPVFFSATSAHPNGRSVADTAPLHSPVRQARLSASASFYPPRGGEEVKMNTSPLTEGV